MKTMLRYGLGVVAGLLLTINAFAQNTLKVSDVRMQPYTTVALPINMTNSQAVVAVQFTMTVPRGAYIGYDNTGVTFYDRGVNHRGAIRQVSDTSYMVMAYSPSNEAFIGRSGLLLSVGLTVEGALEEQTEYDLIFSDVVIAARDGSNIATGWQDGKLRIEATPDLSIRDIQVDRAEYLPGEQISVSWVAENIGQMPLRSGWNINIHLLGANGEERWIGSFRKDLGENVFAAGATEAQTVVCEIPQIVGMDGAVRVRVELSADWNSGETYEHTGNNVAVLTDPVTMGKRLFVDAPARLAEREIGTQYFYLSRSGSTATAETVELSVNDSRLTVSSPVTIPEGEPGVYVNMIVSANGAVDPDSIATIHMAPETYGVLDHAIIIEDDALPNLHLDYSATQVTEGDALQITVRVDRASNFDITMPVICSARDRIECPETIDLPAGSTSVTMDVTAKENMNVDPNDTVRFEVMSPHYNAAQLKLLVLDNDMPGFTFELSPLNVTESAGMSAISGYLTRTSLFDREVTFRLFDNSLNRLNYSTTEITLPKNTQAARFTIGVVDNRDVDTTLDVAVTAAVLMPSCWCVTTEEAGRRTQTIHILDDDGPALRLSVNSSMLLEGDEDGIELTVTRNTAPEGALTVNLSADDETGLIFGRTVTIPDGERSATVVVRAQANDISGDGRTIAFMAQAENYSMGSTWVILSDQTLPDAQIGALEANKTEAIAGEEQVQLLITVVNRGAAELPEGTEVLIRMSGRELPYASLTTSQAIQPKQQAVFTKNIQLPAKPGYYDFTAVVNESRRVEELLYTNNVSLPLTLRAKSPVEATMQTDKTAYLPGETIHITGQVQGATAAQTIEVYAVNGDYRYAQQVTTAADGAFSFDYTPIAGLYGRFGFGACRPGAKDDQAAVSAQMLGFKQVSLVAIYPTVGEVFDGKISLRNLSDSTLTGISGHVDPNSGLSGVESLTFDPISLEGNATKEISYHLLMNAPSTGEDWIRMPLVYTSAEGVEVHEFIYFYARSARAQLATDIEELNITVTQGTTRDLEVVIRNEGFGETGPITFALPSFISTVTPSTLTSLKSHETATAILRFGTPDDMMLNVPITGQFGINCENGNGIAVPYQLEAVSGSTGTLTIDVTDEYTYHTAEAPHVQGATVIIKQPVTGIILAQGKTDANGRYSIELNEGYYDIEVIADKHDSHTQTVLVNPDRETVETVIISLTVVSVDWKVVETEIEDEYEIVSTVVYETNVPAPVVVIDFLDRINPDDMRPCEQRIVMMKMYNKGLIRAEQVRLILPDNNELDFEALAYNTPFDLEAKDSVIIPIRMTKVSPECPGRNGATGLYGDGSGNGNGSDSGAGSGTGSGSGSGSGGGIGTGDGSGSGSGDGGSGTGSGGGGDDGGSGSGSGGSGSGEGGSGSGEGGSGSGEGGEGGSGSGEGGEGGGTQDNSDCDPEKDFYCGRLRSWTYVADCEIHNCAEYLVKCGKTYKKKVACTSTPLRSGCDHVPQMDTGNEDVPPPGRKTDDVNKISEETAQPGKASINTDDCDTCTHNFKQNFNSCYISVASLIPIVGKINTYITCGKAEYEFFNGIISDSFRDCILGFIPVVSDIATVVSIIRDCGTPLFDPCHGLIQAELNNFAPQRRILGDGGTIHHQSGQVIFPFNPYSEQKDFSQYPSEIQTWTDRTVYTWRAAEAYEGIMLEILGRASMLNMTPEETTALYSYLRTYGADANINSVKPDTVPQEDFDYFVARWNNTWSGDTTSGNFISPRVIHDFMRYVMEADNVAFNYGYNDPADLLQQETNNLIDEFQETPSGICASITLQFSQKAVFARQAFRGTLTVTNGHESLQMDSVVLKLKLINQTTGGVATMHEFQINMESLEGFTGEMSLESGWNLAAQQTGVATVLFIPTKYAALDESTPYAFGGELSYKDPNTGYVMTQLLMPQILTVNPSPNLQLTYFMQRDILGDDAMTEDKIEPMEEAEFALLINNIGNGDAKNMRLKTEQPKIIENEKGLYINFMLVRSLHNGQSAPFALDGTVTNNLGTIAAHSTSYVQWFLTSTLMGHFTNYDVTATHLTSYGNPDLSLLDTVTIHELIRSIDMYNGVGWLCNDVVDARDLPDALYGSDGSWSYVSRATAITTFVDVTHYEMTVSGADGWVYGNLNDPTEGDQQLTRVVRRSDGKQISLRNVWQSHVTLRDGKQPLYENRLHFVDSIAAAPEIYDLYFEESTVDRLFVDHFEGVPYMVSDSLVTGIDVVFSKPVAVVSFTNEDLSLTCNGVALDMSEVTVQAMSESVFHIDLSSVSLTNGYYILELNMNSIVDTEGLSGLSAAGGNKAYWSQFVEGIVTDIENVQVDVQGTKGHTIKLIENGQLIIIKDGVRYNVLGAELKSER